VLPAPADTAAATSPRANAPQQEPFVELPQAEIASALVHVLGAPRNARTAAPPHVY